MDGMKEEDGGACLSADIFKNEIAKDDEESADTEDVHWPVYMGVLKKCDMGYLKVSTACPSPQEPLENSQFGSARASAEKIWIVACPAGVVS